MELIKIFWNWFIRFNSYKYWLLYDELFGFAILRAKRAKSLFLDYPYGFGPGALLDGPFYTQDDVVRAQVFWARQYSDVLKNHSDF